MPERPLLLFPTPEKADRSKLGGGGGTFKKPTPKQQWGQFSPEYRRLMQAFDARRVEVLQSTAGINPEFVLVLEIIGHVDEFAKAARNIKGLELMSEIEIDEISPDDRFYDENKPEGKFSGQLYLVMTDQQALREMFMLWRRYSENPNMKFKRGLAKFKPLFLQLKTIRKWDVQDRLQETGVIDVWKEELELDKERPIRFETELWFRENKEFRKNAVDHIKALVEQDGGRIITQSSINEVAYHGLLMELPVKMIQSIVDAEVTELVKCEYIMFFRPVGQMVVGDKLPKGEAEITDIEEKPMPTGEPIVALLDGLPIANHKLLEGRLIVDDPDNLADDYEVSERMHGTAMASLIVNGDLNKNQATLPRPVYIRPILKPIDIEWIPKPREERIPKDSLAIDLIHRAVRRIFEGDQSSTPVASQVKIINLSVGDAHRQFTHSMSPLARLLDWLSFKYRVLFVVSAGNHPGPIELRVSQAKFNSLTPDERETEIIKALYWDSHKRRLLSPAETINGLTIGAAHYDESQIHTSENRINPFEPLLPSPISAFGNGYRGAIKPDFIFQGGRQLYDLSLESTNMTTIKPSSYQGGPPGNKVAAPGTPASELGAILYRCGTSNATALVSRAGCFCYDSLQDIFSDQAVYNDLEIYSVPLLKAMLVHGCSWDNVDQPLWNNIDQHPNTQTNLSGLAQRRRTGSAKIESKHKPRITQWMGYGIPNTDSVLDCTPQRVTLLGYGELSDGDAHVFHLPLPPSLSARPEWKRLTVTLAWLSPISPRTQKYRTASLWFDISSKIVNTERQNAKWQAVRRGTSQHEIFEGKSAVPFNDGDDAVIKVSCRKDAGNIEHPIVYGLVVSLETSEATNIDIYNEIRARIPTRVQIQ